MDVNSTACWVVGESFLTTKLQRDLLQQKSLECVLHLFIKYLYCTNGLSNDAKINCLANYTLLASLIELVDKVINGDVEVTKEQGEMLGNLFHVDASLFIE